MLQRSSSFSSVSDATCEEISSVYFFTNYCANLIIILPAIELTPLVTDKGRHGFLIAGKVYSPPRSPGVWTTPPSLVVKQIRQLFSFYFNAFTSDDVHDVVRYCAPAKADEIVPSSFLDRYFSQEITGQEAEAVGFEKFVDKLVSLTRQDFLAVMRCVATHELATLLLPHNPESAYSLLVFCIEALAQSIGSSPTWADYPREIRQRLEPHFVQIEDSLSEGIKAVLLEAAHVQLGKRVRDFASRHVSDSFFAAEPTAEGRRLRKSYLGHVINNAYDLRSRYAHELLAAANALMLDGGPPGDVARIIQQDPRVPDKHNDKDFLTLRGLQKLVREVVLNFVQSSPSHDGPFELAATEEPPGATKQRLPPDYWLNSVANFTEERADAWFEGLLEAYHTRTMSRQSEPRALGVSPQGLFLFDRLPQAKVDPVLVGGKASELLTRAQKSNRPALVAISLLCEMPIKLKQGQEKCSPEILTALLLTQQLPIWPAEQCERCVMTYLSDGRRRFPEIVELALAVSVANAWLERGEISKYQEWMDRAYLDSASFPSVQTTVGQHRSEHLPLPISAFLPPYRTA